MKPETQSPKRRSADPMRHGAIPNSPLQAADGSLQIATVPDAGIALLMHGADVSLAHLAASFAGNGQAVSLRRQSPEQTILVATGRRDEAWDKPVRALLGPGIHWLDQSHGRQLVTVSGPMAVEALSHGIGIDMNEEVFSVGRSEPTSYGHISVNLARTGDARYELIVLRSYAGALWSLLAARCRVSRA